MTPQRLTRLAPQTEHACREATAATSRSERAAAVAQDTTGSLV
jgi:hypothetical protein